MAIQRRYCKNHPDRPAIGVCIITHQAICAECSTRYEGVNYSKEGLRILQERRQAQESAGSGTVLSAVLLLLLSPLMLLMVYWSYSLGVTLVMNMVHGE